MARSKVFIATGDIVPAGSEGRGIAAFRVGDEVPEGYFDAQPHARDLVKEVDPGKAGDAAAQARAVSGSGDTIVVPPTV